MTTPGGIVGSRGTRQETRDWLVPLAVLAIAFLAAFVVERLNERVFQLNDARVLLAHLEEDAAEQHAAQEVADRDERVTYSQGP